MTATWILLLLAPALPALQEPTPGERPDRPPVAEDLRAMLEVVRQVEAAAREGGRGVGGILLGASAEDQARMARFLKERATPEVHATFAQGGAARALSALMGDEPVRAPVKVRTATLPDGTAVAEAELRMRARGSEGDGHPVLLAYRKTDAGWLLDRLPTPLFETSPARAVAPHATVVRVEPEVSPVVVLRAYAAGAVPDDVRAAYAERGVAIPDDQPWVDATWRGEPVHYPGCDSFGRTDPWRRGEPDRWAMLERVARDEWMPYLSFLEEDGGLDVVVDPITLDADAAVPAETLVGALRVLAREPVLMPTVRLRVAQAPGFAGVCVLELDQPLDREAQADQTIVAAGLTGMALREAILEQGVVECIGVRPGPGDTVAQVIATLDALAELGHEVFVAALPQG